MPSLRDTTKTPLDRKAAAAGIWRKLLVQKRNDPVTTAQVADLLRQAELVDQALALYKRAAELAPTNPQYHEYIGEYLHNLKRPDEALAAPPFDYFTCLLISLTASQFIKYALNRRTAINNFCIVNLLYE